MLKHRETFRLTRFLRITLVILPMSIALIYYGMMSFPFALQKHTGKIDQIYQKNNHLYIKLTTSQNIFETGEPEKINLIRNKIDREKNIIIYKKRVGQNTIFKIKQNNNIILDYNISLFEITILIVGLGLLLLVIYYLIKSPEDLWRGNKEKMKKDLDPWSKYKN